MAAPIATPPKELAAWVSLRSFRPGAERERAVVPAPTATQKLEISPTCIPKTLVGNALSVS